MPKEELTAEMLGTTTEVLNDFMVLCTALSKKSWTPYQAARIIVATNKMRHWGNFYFLIAEAENLFKGTQLNHAEFDIVKNALIDLILEQTKQDKGSCTNSNSYTLGKVTVQSNDFTHLKDISFPIKAYVKVRKELAKKIGEKTIRILEYASEHPELYHDEAKPKQGRPSWENSPYIKDIAQIIENIINTNSGALCKVIDTKIEEAIKPFFKNDKNACVSGDIWRKRIAWIRNGKKGNRPR